MRTRKNRIKGGIGGRHAGIRWKNLQFIIGLFPKEVQQILLPDFVYSCVKDYVEHRTISLYDYFTKKTGKKMFNRKSEDDPYNPIIRLCKYLELFCRWLSSYIEEDYKEQKDYIDKFNNEFMKVKLHKLLWFDYTSIKTKKYYKLYTEQEIRYFKDKLTKFSLDLIDTFKDLYWETFKSYFNVTCQKQLDDEEAKRAKEEAKRAKEEADEEAEEAKRAEEARMAELLNILSNEPSDSDLLKNVIDLNTNNVLPHYQADEADNEDTTIRKWTLDNLSPYSLPTDGGRTKRKRRRTKRRRTKRRTRK